MKLIISDVHLAPFREEKFLTQKKNFIEIIIQFFAEKGEKREGRMTETIKKVVEAESIDTFISNGDFVESRRTERGMNTPEDLEMACTLRDSISRKLGLKKRIKSNLGNHESGYDLPLGTDSERGINRQALENFLSFAQREELYCSFFEDGYKIIFVPYIFSEEKAKDFDLAEEKKKFLSNMARDLEEDIPTILLVHDPDSFDDPELMHIIRSNRTKIKCIFYGHYHSWINLLGMKIISNIYVKKWLTPVRLILDWIFLKLAKGDAHIVSELGKYFRKRKNIPTIIKELGAILTPAPFGTLGIGGGFLVVDIDNEGICKIKKHKL